MSKYFVSHAVEQILPDKDREFSIDAIFGDFKFKKQEGDDPKFGATIQTEVVISAEDGKKIATFTFEQLRKEDGKYSELQNAKGIEVFEGGREKSFKGIFEKAASSANHQYTFLIEKGYITKDFFGTVLVHHKSAGQLKIHEGATEQEISELASFFSSEAITKDGKTVAAELFVIEALKEKGKLKGATEIKITQGDDKLVADVAYPGRQDLTAKSELQKVTDIKFYVEASPDGAHSVGGIGHAQELKPDHIDPESHSYE